MNSAFVDNKYSDVAIIEPLTYVMAIYIKTVHLF